MDSQLSSSSERGTQVLVYVRNSDKSSVKIFIPTPIELSMLAGIVETETSTHKDNLIIFYQGKAYPADLPDETEEIQLDITSNSIVHVRDARKMTKGQINLTVEVIKSNNKKGDSKKYQISSSERIGQFLLHILESQQYADLVFFVEAGRILSRDKTFYQESIQNGSIVSLVVRETPISQHLEIKLKNLETKTPEPENKKIPTRQFLASGDLEKVIGIDFQAPSPNFKKKKNNAVCVVQPLAASTNLGRWQSQRSEDPHTDKLATSLRWKKVDDTNSQKAEKERQRLTPTGKSQLKEEFRKLFQIDLSDEKEQQKKAKPPCLNIFQEDEADEFTFQQEQEEQQEQEQDQYQKKNGINHTASSE